jgi:hypothetical protein
MYSHLFDSAENITTFKLFNVINRPRRNACREIRQLKIMFAKDGIDTQLMYQITIDMLFQFPLQ